MEEFMRVDGLEAIYKDAIAPSAGSVIFAKALNRSITGTMNDIESAAQVYIIEEGDSLENTTLWLNESIHACLGRLNPREVFLAMRTEG